MNIPGFHCRLSLHPAPRAPQSQPPARKTRRLPLATYESRLRRLPEQLHRRLVRETPDVDLQYLHERAEEKSRKNIEYVEVTDALEKSRNFQVYFHTPVLNHDPHGKEECNV